MWLVGAAKTVSGNTIGLALEGSFSVSSKNLQEYWTQPDWKQQMSPTLRAAKLAHFLPTGSKASKLAAAA
jgi:hypothetical protein